MYEKVLLESPWTTKIVTSVVSFLIIIVVAF